MIDFFRSLVDPDMSFLYYAVLTSVFASVAFGVVGSYVVSRRISSIAGAIAHSVLGGIGFSVFLQAKFGISWFVPMYGAIAAAVLGALVIGWVSTCAKEREDTVISVIWALGMSVGLVFLALCPGYVDINSYLFGDILLVSKQDFYIVLVLDIFVLLAVIIFYNKFLAVCFDNRFSTIRGVRVKIYYFFMLVLIALTIVLLLPVVGIIMVIALLTLPAASAGFFTRRLSSMMILAVIFSFLFTTSGLALSCDLNLPAGPIIIILAALVYLLCLLIARVIKKRG